MRALISLIAIALASITTLDAPKASVILAAYQGNEYTTNLDPQNLGCAGCPGTVHAIYAQVWLEFPAALFPAIIDVTGTFTFADQLHWAAIYDFGNMNYFGSSSQGPNVIDPQSFVRFENGNIVEWAIQGIGQGSTSPCYPNCPFAFLQSTSSLNNPFAAPIRDYAQELVSGDYAVVENNPGNWHIFYATGFPVPGPIVGSGLPGLLLLIGWWARRRQIQAMELIV